MRKQAIMRVFEWKLSIVRVLNDQFLPCIDIDSYVNKFRIILQKYLCYFHFLFSNK